MSDIDYVDASLPGEQAISKLYRNDLKISGKADQGIFDRLELDNIYDRIGNRFYVRDLELGNTLVTYTDWVNMEDYSGYSVWSYPVSNFTDDDGNELYINDTLLTYMGAATSEISAVGFTGVYMTDNKRSGETFTDVTTEAGTEAGTPFYTCNVETFIEDITPTLSGIELDYVNILNGTVTVETTVSAVTHVTYTENDDYEIDYDDGIVSLLSGTTISGAVQITYSVGSTMYIGLSATTFGSIDFGLAQKGTGNVFNYEYYLSGTGFSSFSPDLDSTSNLNNNGLVTFSGLTSWGATTINSLSAYWIKMNLVTRGITFPTANYILRANSSVESLLKQTAKELKEYNYKWCFYNDKVYVSIPNTGASNGEGNTYIKSSSSVANKQNYFIYNNEYKINYRNTTTDTGIILSGGIQLGDDISVASASNVGTLRYRESGDNSYIEICMKTGGSSYSWEEIIRHSW